MPKILNPTISCTIVYTLPPLFNMAPSATKVLSTKDVQTLPDPSGDAPIDFEALRRRLFSPSEVYYAIVVPIIQQTRAGLAVADAHGQLQESGIEISLRAFDQLLSRVGTADEIPAWSRVRNGYLMAAFRRWTQTSIDNDNVEVSEHEHSIPTQAI